MSDLNLIEVLGKIKPFDGKQENLLDFINTLERNLKSLKKVKNLTQQQEQIFFRNIISDKLTNQIRFLLKTSNKSTWKHIKRNLFRLFLDKNKKSPDYWLNSIVKSKQRNSEDLIAFSNRLQYYFVNLMDSFEFKDDEIPIGYILIYENFTKSSFIDGLQRDEFKTTLKHLKPKDLEEAVELSIQFENNLDEDYEKEHLLQLESKKYTQGFKGNILEIIPE